MNTKNSKKLEKSRGIVAFAVNTETTDYVSIATKTLQVASQVLNLPYTILTNTKSANSNQRYDIDSGQFVQWNNFNRYSVYESSPYDETLVIDVDYLVLDSDLKLIFETEWDYLLQRNSHALTQAWPNTMGPHSLPFVWATVFAFRKTARAKMFFELVARIQNNYGYYHSLFNIRERNYRNDYAFAIADYILNGYTVQTNSIPGSMLTVDQAIESITAQNNKLIIKDKNLGYVIPKTNVHIMSKAYLQSDNFKNLVESL
jgi:hypothetical protein